MRSNLDSMVLTCSEDVAVLDEYKSSAVQLHCFLLVLPSLPLLFLRCVTGSVDIIVHCEDSHLGTRSAAHSAIRFFLHLMVKFFD